MQITINKTARKCLTIFFLILISSFSVTAQLSGDDLPRQGLLGVQVAAVTSEQRAQMKLPADQGIAVMRVDAGSSAEVAGLKSGDIILKVGDMSVNSVQGFVNIIRPFRANQNVALAIMRVGERQTINVTLKPRPLETSPEFDVLYRAVHTKGGRRRVIVTKPKASGKYPAVLMVGGIGCYSLDNFQPTDAYRKILYGLTQQGFATMRVEKTGMGDSEGASCQSPEANLRQEVEGFVAGLRALKNYDFVDADKTFIFGHSIGGIVGPLVAAEVPVRGLIVVATIGTNWFEYALENYRRQAVLRGAPYEEIEREARLYRDCKRNLWLDRQTPGQILKENQACEPFLPDPAPYTYMQQLTALNLAETWKKVTAPTLIIYGSSDFLTSTEEHEYLRNMINSFQPNRATFIEIPGMDHFFHRAATQRESLERLGNPTQTPPQFVEQALSQISNWLNKTI